MYPSKNILGVYLPVYTVVPLRKKTSFSAIFKCGKPPVFGAFLYIFGSLGAYLPPLTPSSTTRCPGTPPANIQCTKQFLSL
jgi:hypothetical protein